MNSCRDFSLLTISFSLLTNLNLLYCNFCISLTVALFAVVLFTTFFLENNDLVTFPVADDRRFNGGIAADLRIFARPDDQGFEIDLLARFLVDSGHAKRLAAFDRKLLSACSDNCVTHYCVISLSPKAIFLPVSRKDEIILKFTVKVNGWPGFFWDSFARMLATPSGLQIQAIVVVKSGCCSKFTT